MKTMTVNFSKILIVSTLLAQSILAGNKEAIQPYQKNPAYWQYKGKPVLLLGGSDDDNVFNWEDRESIIKQLDLLASVGGNYDRCVMSSRDTKMGNVKPYKQLDNGKYDLTRWNDLFWDRFEFYLNACAKRDIIAQIEIWATYDIGSKASPFNPENNIQSDMKNSILDYHHSGRQNRAYFYNTIPELAHDKIALKYQQAFMDKVLSHTFKFDNVLYCIDNEYHFEDVKYKIGNKEYNENPSEWYVYWAKYIMQKAKKAGRIAAITEMNQVDWSILLKRRSGEPLDAGDLKRMGGDWNPVLTTKHREVYRNVDLLTFIDIGNCMGNSSPTEHWDHLQSIRKFIKDIPHPLNNVKLYGNDYNTFWPTQEAVNKFWRNLIGGCASVRFHRPPAGQGLNALAQASIKSAKLFETLIKPWECEPRMDVIHDKGKHPLYVMANVPMAYAVLIPHRVTQNDWIKLNLEGGNKYDIMWINVNTGEHQVVMKDKRCAKWMALSPPEFVYGGTGLALFYPVESD